MKKLAVLVLCAILIGSFAENVMAGSTINTNTKLGYKVDDGNNTFFLDRLAFHFTEEFSNYNGLKSEIWIYGEEPVDAPIIDDLNIIRAYYYHKSGNSTFNIGYLPVPWSPWQSIALQTSPADKEMIESSLGFQYDYQFEDELFKISVAVVNASNNSSENDPALNSSTDYALRASYQPISGLTVNAAGAVDNYLESSTDQCRDTKMVFDVLYEYQSFRTYLEQVSVQKTINGVKDPTRTGTYLECAYFFSDKIRGYVGATSCKDLYLDWKTVGMIYSFAPATSIQLEYLKWDDNKTKYELCLQTWL